MSDGRYWVTYISKREHGTGTDSNTYERITDSAGEASTYACEFMRSAQRLMDWNSNVTECVVHVYDTDSGTFPIYRTLQRVGRYDGLRWSACDE